MRKKLQHILSVFVVIFAAIPIANAAASDYNVAAQTPGKVWSHTFTLPGGDAYQTAVLPNGYLYVIGTNTNFVDSYKTLYRINESGVTTGSAGYTAIHYGLAADDNGKIILLDQAWSVSTFIDYVSIRKPNATTGHLEYVTGSHFDISAHNLPSYCYYIDATGDLENGTGYIWFPPVASNADIKVVKTVRTAGQNAWTTTKTNYTLPFKPGRSDSYMQVYESNEANNTWKFLFQNTGENLYDCTLSNGTITATPITLPVAQTKKDISNSHIFFLGGHKMLAYNTGTVTRSNQFIVYDMTTKTTIATVNPFSTTVSGANGMIGSWINSLKVSETQTDLFIYSPAVGASRLSLKATPITNPVTSLSAAVVSGTKSDVKVTWVKPSAGNPTKYAVSYSTNGGTSWSAEVETTNLNYTYTNLADGTYTFKVRAYYGGSSTWGQTTTSNSVTIVNYTDPVTNMQVQAGSGMPYSAIVNWAAPSGDGTPTKYAVSYSTNGGTSWSAAVETTSLSYTYSGLAQGEYVFKVTPYYGAVAGEATTKTATVYGVTTPVPTVNVAYSNNTGNCIAVSWTEPAADVAPQKYQVCYSADGGTSWSAAIETTELTYTFNNLPLGAYTFKVTPIYNGVAGDAVLSESINSLAPSGYTFTTSKRWEVAGTWGTDAAPDGRSIAVSNNKMYVASPNTDTKIAYISQGTSSSSWPNFETGFAKQSYGLAMDNDDAGNIIMSSGTYFGSSGGFAQFTIYPAGATSNASKVDIALEGDYLPGSRCDFIAAQGNLLSSAGGYVWLAPNAGQKIMRIKIANGALAGVTTWTQTMSSTTNTNQIVLRPLDDGRLYFHLRGSGYKIITLPAAGEEITADMVETIPATGYAFNPYSNVNSDMFTLLGYNFHVRNDGAEAQSIGVEIKNLTDAGNGDAAFTPFEGKTPAGGNSSVTKMNGYGSLVRAVNVDEYTTDVYCYTINHGVTVYRVTASPVYTVTGAIKSLDYEYTTTATDEGTRQDVTLTWTAPEEATPTSYKVYRNGTLIATVASPALTYTDKNVNANHTYTVIPYFAGVAEDEALGLSVTTTEVQTVLFAPIITEMRSYDGYSIAQFFFKMPSLSKVKPASYNVYRDGILLESGITQLNYIDDDLPKIEKEVEESHDYVYTVEAVYSSTYDNATRMSEGKTATVTYRDWSLAGYLLQDVYNVPINQALGNMPVNFTNYEYYRQGHFYNGSWYIAERSDALSKKDQDKANGIANSARSEIESDDANATGGVVTFDATNEIDVRRGMTGKVITNDAFESVGLAMDDNGTIFVRNNNLTKLAATAPSDGNPTQILGYPDGFTRRITEGALYKLTDGTYPSEPTAIVDLSALWTDNRFIDEMVFTSGKSNGQVAGRSDYYYMYGNVMSAEGGYLLISPSWTRTIFKVKIVNGAYDSHEVLQFPESYTEENQYTGKTETHAISTGTENYGFRIAGRDAWMAQIRSQGYFGIHGVDADHAEGEHEHEWHAIFDTESRINNSGGTSIVAFDNPLTTEVNDGETFLITPACMYSKNQGDFIVTRGIKGAIDEDVSASKLAPPMPVAQYKQTSQNTNIATNANGNWFHAEKGTYESVSGEEEECVYIYQYVPGVRFAKYRLIPDNQLPVVYPTLEIATAYNSDKTDITHFNGVSTWNRPSGFGEANPENSRVWIDSYTYQLLDPNGKKIYETNVPEQYNADGTLVTSYSISTELMNEKTDSIAFNNYTARVAVNYQFATGATQQSVFNLAIDNNDYIAQPATDQSVNVFVKEDNVVSYWVQDAKGEWVVETKTVDSYRVDLDFNAPVWDDDNDAQPVSYYTVKAAVKVNVKDPVTGDVTQRTDTIDIKDFALHQGSEIKDGKIWAKTTKTSQIPGTYNFAETGGDKAPYFTTYDAESGTGLYKPMVDGGSYKNVVLSWFYDKPVEAASEPATMSLDLDENTEIVNTPDEWQFFIVAHYAARNIYIDKDATVSTMTELLTPTGLEVVGDDNVSSLSIYPIPASTSITIKSGEAINSIVIYTEAGAEVMNLNGDGDTITEVNIESLATGYYFVKVNNQALVKIIKK